MRVVLAAVTLTPGAYSGSGNNGSLFPFCARSGTMWMLLLGGRFDIVWSLFSPQHLPVICGKPAGRDTGGDMATAKL